MPVFLDEDMMGRDAATIGFPHLLICMGFVARTNNDLSGVHLTSADTSQETFLAFWAWAQGKGLAAGAITEIYGCCNRRIRYGNPNPAGAWAEEMEWFAHALGPWHGLVRGFDTNVLDPRHGTYVEYRWQLAAICWIFYKLHEETASTGLSRPIPDNPLNDVRTYNASAPQTGTFNRQAFMKRGMATTVGQLHELNYALRLSQVPV
jgi:hypothetical protein